VNDKEGKRGSELTNDSQFYEQVGDFLINARKYVKRQVDNTITVTYYLIGRMIVEREQQG